jgi:hypothetical protein
MTKKERRSILKLTPFKGIREEREKLDFTLNLDLSPSPVKVERVPSIERVEKVEKLEDINNTPETPKGKYTKKYSYFIKNFIFCMNSGFKVEN